MKSIQQLKKIVKEWESSKLTRKDDVYGNQRYRYAKARLLVLKAAK